MQVSFTDKGIKMKNNGMSQTLQTWLLINQQSGTEPNLKISADHEHADECQGVLSCPE
jgi:hypothetical protein